MRYKDGLAALRGGTPGGDSRWWLFPWAITLAMLAVIVVNAGMIYAALHTFPGQAGSDGFDLSNHDDAVLTREARQSALGWRVQAAADATHRPVLLLSDHDGAPLTGAVVQATAERPVGPTHSTALAFREIAPGRYVADAALSPPGQWDLLLSAGARAHELVATRRIVVR
jgi:nitrogen fixation protein FixH